MDLAPGISPVVVPVANSEKFDIEIRQCYKHGTKILFINGIQMDHIDCPYQHFMVATWEDCIIPQPKEEES